MRRRTASQAGRRPRRTVGRGPGAPPPPPGAGPPGPRPPRLTFACLGSSGAAPSAERDTTALAVRAGGSLCLVDVGGSPVKKLRRLAVDPLELSAVVVTHTHPDHVYGLPALVQSLVILGRHAPLPVYCRGQHLYLVLGL